VVVALSVLLLLRRERLGEGAFTAGLVLAPPLATAFKLTGAGVGVGLALASLQARRWRALGPLAASAVLCVATIPLYDALFGHFHEYALGLMSHHEVNWERAVDATRLPQGRLVALALIGTITASGYDQQRRLSLLLAMLLGLGAVTSLAFFKEGGRANNLVAPALVALVIVLVALGRDEPGPGRVDVLALAGLVALTAGPLTRSSSDALALARQDHVTAVAFVHEELARGQNPLVHSGTTIWVEAGGQGIPRDQLHPAIELFLARHPAFETHIARVSSGSYGSIVTPGETFLVKTTSGARFGDRMRDAMKGYCVVYPRRPDGSPIAFEEGEGRLLILRRRDRGCAPVASGA
jgi:hypothetical protein